MSGSFSCELLDEERDIEFSIVVHWAVDEGWEGDRWYAYVDDVAITSARVLVGSIPNRLAWAHAQPARKGLWLTVNDVEKIDVPEFIQSYKARLDSLLVSEMADKSDGEDFIREERYAREEQAKRERAHV